MTAHDITLPPGGGNGLTMSSLEIAGLVGKRHDHVARDIKKMFDGLKIQPVGGAPIFGGTYLDVQGKERPCFNLPQRETLILVSGYDVEMRARIIDRWAELERAIRSDAIMPVSVADLSAEVRKVVGGITKSVVHAELTEAMTALIPQLVAAQFAERNYMLRHGRTAGQIWDRYNLPKLKNAAKWFSNRLVEMGCLLNKADQGARSVRLFDPDQAETVMGNGLLLRCRQYVAERKGQGVLKLVPANV